jgi:hypothetical protein
MPAPRDEIATPRIILGPNPRFAMAESLATKIEIREKS